MVLFNLVLQDSYDVVNHQSEMYQLKKPNTYCYLIYLKLHPLHLLEVLWRGFLWKLFERGDQDLIRTFGLNFLSFWIFVLLSVPKVNIPYHKLQESWHLPRTSTAKALCFMNCFCVLLQDHKTHTKSLHHFNLLCKYCFYICLCRSIFKSTGYYFHLFVIAGTDYLTSLPHLTFSVVQKCISLVCSELHHLHVENRVFNPPQKHSSLRQQKDFTVVEIPFSNVSYLVLRNNERKAHWLHMSTQVAKMKTDRFTNITKSVMIVEFKVIFYRIC